MNTRYVLKSIVADVLGIEGGAEAIKDNANLFDYGLDSMNVLGVVIGAENELNVTLDPSDLAADIFEDFEVLYKLVEQEKGQ